MALKYIYGYHSVIAGLSTSSLIKIKKIFLVQEKHQDLQKQFKKTKKIYEMISLQSMNNLLGTTKHQNIAASVNNYQYISFERLMTINSISKYFRFLVLDRISDPYNFGSMIRIAAGNNFDSIIILNHNHSEINSLVAKVAVGALSIIPICRVKNLSFIINILNQKYNFTILAAAKTTKAINYFNINCINNLALIIGNESEGISQKLLKHSNYIVKIPISSRIESFNASVACGIISNYIYIKTFEFINDKI